MKVTNVDKQMFALLAVNVTVVAHARLVAPIAEQVFSDLLDKVMGASIGDEIKITGDELHMLCDVSIVLLDAEMISEGDSLETYLEVFAAYSLLEILMDKLESSNLQ